ncbi:PDR/VanB family oxidoreductase [Streptomyces sp. NPDC021093]|uniref:PDR/VanB family oxidoreductase n=1 Tax=Streptomyces sp. NPDC021093 TaxID=3365112 RepID=UPI0037AF23D2
MSVDTADLLAPKAPPDPRHEYTTVLRVSERERAADGVVTLTLVHPAGRELPRWTPGAHIDLVLPEVDLVRQYSLCGSPDDRHAWRIAVLREPNGRGGSRHVHRALGVGTTVLVRGPRNHFRLEPSARYLFIAGGIGITPILPMVASAEAAGRDWELIYGGRSRASMAFLDELTAYGGRVRIHPQDEAGLLPLAKALNAPRQDCLVYCCGPEPLVGAVESRCAGWPAGSLRTERFRARPVLPKEEKHAAAFEVVCRRSGPTLAVAPHESILDAAERAGVRTFAACREGICGTCETSVVEGVPEHRDSILTDRQKASGETMMICVSRACGSRLVLDL